MCNAIFDTIQCIGLGKLTLAKNKRHLVENLSKDIIGENNLPVELSALVPWKWIENVTTEQWSNHQKFPAFPSKKCKTKKKMKSV